MPPGPFLHIERVESGGEGGGFFVVPRGIVFEKDTFIPLDAVVRRSGNTAFIKVPKLVVGYDGAGGEARPSTAAGSAVIWLALADRGPRDVTSDSRSAV